MMAANKAIAMLNKENIYDLKAVKVASENVQLSMRAVLAYLG
jgi:hypothetical protein